LLIDEDAQVNTVPNQHLDRPKRLKKDEGDPVDGVLKKEARKKIVGRRQRNSIKLLPQGRKGAGLLRKRKSVRTCICWDWSLIPQRDRM